MACGWHIKCTGRETKNAIVFDLKMRTSNLLMNEFKMDRHRVNYQEAGKNRKAKSGIQYDGDYFEETEQSTSRLRKKSGKRFHRKKTLKEVLSGH